MYEYELSSHRSHRYLPGNSKNIIGERSRSQHKNNCIKNDFYIFCITFLYNFLMFWICIQLKDGATPLHCAFQYCSFDIARLLILAGTDPFAVTTDGLMAFDVPPIESDDVTPFTPSKVELNLINS